MVVTSVKVARERQGGENVPAIRLRYNVILDQHAGGQRHPVGRTPYNGLK